jgi:CBS domain-containing protein
VILLDEKISALGFTPPLCIESGTSVAEVVEQIRKRNVGCVVVCHDSRIIGIMTERDVLMKVVARDVKYDEPVDSFMTPSPLTLGPDNSVAEAISLMNRENFRHIPIVRPDNGEVLAVFSIKDVIDYLVESFPEKVINLPPRPHQTMRTREGA